MFTDKRGEKKNEGKTSGWIYHKCSNSLSNIYYYYVCRNIENYFLFWTFTSEQYYRRFIFFWMNFNNIYTTNKNWMKIIMPNKCLLSSYWLINTILISMGKVRHHLEQQPVSIIEPWVRLVIFSLYASVIAEIIKIILTLYRNGAACGKL